MYNAQNREDIALEIIIYVFSASFGFMAAALLLTYRRTRDRDVMLLAASYGIAALLAIMLKHWWPLAAGFAAVWILRLSGVDPDKRNRSSKEGERGK